MLNSYGTVYSMTNSAQNNQIIAFGRNTDGTLFRLNAYNTGGSGTGAQATDPLASQGAVILSKDKRLLFAVNAGSGSISSFSVCSGGGLSLVSVVPSGGSVPNSLAVFGNILYVSNSGKSGSQDISNITGFQFDCCGHLRQIPCAKYPLSTQTARPACVVFSPSGDKLIVSELSTNQITVYPASCKGCLKQATVNPSVGAGPFGSVYLNSGTLLVVEAGANAISSYTVSNSGTLTVISGSVKNNQNAACWISVSRNGQTAYTSNAGSNSISVYHIQPNGAVSFVKNVVNNPNGTAAPLDSGVSTDGKNLYVLNGNEGTISCFEISADGDLTLIQIFTDTQLPQMGAQGLAVL